MLFNRCILPLYQTFACMHACMHNPVLHLDPSEKILQIVAWNSAYKVAVYRTCPYSTRVLLSSLVPHCKSLQSTGSEKKQNFIAANAFALESECVVDISTCNYHFAYWISKVSGQVARKFHFYAYSMLWTLLHSAVYFLHINMLGVRCHLWTQ